MGNFVIKLKDSYLVWSTVVDAPTTLGIMDKAAIVEELDLKRRYSDEQIAEIFEQVDKTGIYSRNGWTLETLLCANRAGPNESELTSDEIYKAYCLREPIRDGWKAR